jgi:hypothetical protein
LIAQSTVASVTGNLFLSNNNNSNNSGLVKMDLFFGLSYVCQQNLLKSQIKNKTRSKGMRIISKNIEDLSKSRRYPKIQTGPRPAFLFVFHIQ